MKMNVIFVGDVLPAEVFKLVIQVSPSANNVELAILNRLHIAFGDKLHVLSKNFALSAVLPDERIIPARKYITDDNIEIHTIKFMNYKLLKNFTGMYYLYKAVRHLKKEIESKQANKKIIFIVYNPFYQQALPVYFAKSHKDIMLSIIAEGLDIRYLRQKKIRLYDNIAHFVNKCLFKKNRGIVTYCADTVKRYAPKVEYIDLLHACDPNLFEGIKKDFIKTKNVTLLYAGMLTSCYGIDAILNAMKKLPHNYNLVICGSGSEEIINVIKKAENIDGRIHYMGLISREEVIKLEVAADVLLIIRVAESQSDSYIAKYCQPSKIPEYLMSGTPVIATKIPSIPVVFDEYLNYTTESPDAIAKTIISVTSNKNDFYSNKALSGQAFAKANCTYEKQYSKLIEFIRKVWLEQSCVEV